MNKKGFTLIELLVTIVIMALILIMVVPSITALQNNNKEKPYEYYADSLIEAAKIFVDKEGEDINSIGAKNFIGCVDITYQDLIESDLIKPFSDENIDCSNATVRYTKSKKSSSYNYNMTCTDTRNNEVVYEHKEIEDKTCSIIDADDKTPPTCGEVTGDSTEWTKENRTITIDCSDDRNGCESVTKTFDSTTKVGYIEIKDGNNNTTSCPVNVYIDKTPPSNISITGNPGCVTQPATISPILTAVEKESGIAKWQWGYSKDKMEDYPNSASNPYTSTPFSAARNQLAYFKACDKVGNCSDFASTNICIIRKSASIGGNAGNWMQIYWPKYDGSGACAGGVCANVIGKLDISWSNDYGNVSWYFGIGPNTWLGVGYYVNLNIYKNGSYYYTATLKDTYTTWAGSSNPWPSGTISGLYLPTGTYEFYFESNSTDPSFNVNMGTVVVS